MPAARNRLCQVCIIGLIAHIAPRVSKPVGGSPRGAVKSSLLFAKRREEMAKSPPLFCETREVSFGGRGRLCRALRLFRLSFACWVRKPGGRGKVGRRCFSSLAVVRWPLARAGSCLRSAQKKSAHVLCVPTFFRMKKVFLLSLVGSLWTQRIVRRR